MYGDAIRHGREHPATLPARGQQRAVSLGLPGSERFRTTSSTGGPRVAVSAYATSASLTVLPTSGRAPVELAPASSSKSFEPARTWTRPRPAKPGPRRIRHPRAKNSQRPGQLDDRRGGRTRARTVGRDLLIGRPFTLTLTVRGRPGREQHRPQSRARQPTSSPACSDEDLDRRAIMTARRRSSTYGSGHARDTN